MSITPQGDDWWQASDGRWYPPQNPPDPAPQSPSPPPASRKDRALLIVAAVVVAGVVAVAVAMLVGDDDDQTVRVDAPTPEASEPSPEATPAPSPAEPTPEAATPPTTEPSATPTPTPEAGAAELAGDSCRYLGLDDLGQMQIEVALTSTSGSDADLGVEFALQDSGGVRFHTGTAFIMMVAPEEPVRVQVGTFTEPPPGLGPGSEAASCEVLAIDATPPRPSVTASGETDSCRYLGLDDFDQMHVDVVVTSPLDMTADLAIDFAIRLGDGTRIHTNTAFVDLVAPGERIRHVASTFTNPPPGLESDSGSCDVLAIEPLSPVESLVPPGATDSCRYVGVDDFGEMEVEISFTSPFADSADIVATYVLRDGDGMRFVTERWFSELLGPGEEVRQRTSTFTRLPDDVVEADVVCELIGLGEF